MASVTLGRTWAGEGRGEGKEVEPLSLGSTGRGWLGRVGMLSKSGQVFFSNRLQQEQTNGFTPVPAKGEIRKEIGGNKIEQVAAGSRLIHSSGYPCWPGMR